MGWTAPRTWLTREKVTPALLNAHLRDNLLAIQAGILPVAASVLTTETTTSTTLVDLATVGPSVTLDTGSSVLVIVYAGLQNNTADRSALMGYAVSGATTIAGTTLKSISNHSVAASEQRRFSGVFLQTGLTPGSNTFTAKYRAGLTGGTASFIERFITVIPLGLT